MWGRIGSDEDVDRADYYVAEPIGPATGAVVLAPEMYGLTRHTWSICDRLAGEGFVTLAPDLYWRDARVPQLPYTDDGRATGRALMLKLRREQVLADIRDAQVEARRRAGERGGTAVVGFSVGGHVALLAATELAFDLAVTFYGGWTLDGGIPLAEPKPPLADSPRIAGNQVSVLGFVGDHDFLVSPDEWRRIDERLGEAGVERELHSYPGAQHGFFCEDRPETYDADAADDSWRRLVGALHARLSH